MRKSRAVLIEAREDQGVGHRNAPAKMPNTGKREAPPPASAARAPREPRRRGPSAVKHNYELAQPQARLRCTPRPHDDRRIYVLAAERGPLYNDWAAVLGFVFYILTFFVQGVLY